MWHAYNVRSYIRNMTCLQLQQLYKECDMPTNSGVTQEIRNVHNIRSYLRNPKCLNYRSYIKCEVPVISGVK
jgi:hypothetical protein